MIVEPAFPNGLEDGRLAYLAGREKGRDQLDTGIETGAEGSARTSALRPFSVGSLVALTDYTCRDQRRAVADSCLRGPTQGHTDRGPDRAANPRGPGCWGSRDRRRSRSRQTPQCQRSARSARRCARPPGGIQADQIEDPGEGAHTIDWTSTGGIDAFRNTAASLESSTTCLRIAARS
jgi:hypothetical protein